MKAFRSAEELLDYAIRQEELSAEFYRDLAGRIENPSVGNMLRELAAEEDIHREKLVELKAGKRTLLSTDDVMDLGIAEMLEIHGALGDMDFEKALVFAMKREQAAFDMYSQLAGMTRDTGVRSLLEGLAHEEATHRLRLETEYDEHVLTQG